MTIRDCHGSVLLITRLSFPYCIDSAIAEARGLVEAARLCLLLEFDNFCLEGDARQVGHVVQSNVPDVSVYGCLISDVHHLLQKTEAWQIQHVKREANMAANYLAIDAIHRMQAWQINVVDIDFVDPCISNVVRVDCPSLSS